MRDASRAAGPSVTRYGIACRCGPMTFAIWLPALASQFVDHVIAPPMAGQVAGGWKLPQLLPLARQSRAALTTLGVTWPPPAALVEAGTPRPTWLGFRPPCSWMQASAVRKFSVPSPYTWPSQPSMVP